MMKNNTAKKNAADKFYKAPALNDPGGGDIITKATWNLKKVK